MGKGSKGARTKQLILEKAFVLFSNGAYNNVSLRKIEEVTGLSRGALLFHFPAKEQMFSSVVDKYVLQNLSASRNVDDKEKITLKKFINSYTRQLSDLKKELFELGITNMSFALVNLNLQAFHFYPNFADKAKAWNKTETMIWHAVISNAAESGEINKNNNVTILASMFKNLFHGTGYEGINTTNDIDINLLEQEYLLLYNSLLR
ncbi:TetR family transcriptional regulator [Maribellus comscasis]|uniref:TetR family transcriptional regulator n=1 Tax=Maribellus comscasis TaxID=2681766 RepID=A0A6I6JNH7_9BACT|nr:TetR/AcrR family transcriptional regulator [Maribellus comscasis]QGY44475.1 TetR family transcriptional regulator [Maribellus comscasis]